MGSMVINPIEFFPDLSGLPLNAGYVYIGVANENPMTNPVTVYQDNAMTIPMTQPLRTIAGAISLNGTPQTIYISTPTYSIAVTDKAGRLVMSLPSVTNPQAFAQSLLGSLQLVVNSIAQLRTLSKLIYANAFVTSYWGTDDYAGGGPYVLDPTDTSSADNGGTIIVANDGGRWKLKFNLGVSIKQFGCKCNSSGTGGTGADDTTYAQNAISWAQSNNMGQDLVLDEGIARMTSTLSITAPVSMRGITVDPRNVGESGIGGGSWLYFNHAGKGISITQPNGNYKGVTFRSFGTIRDQPTIAPGWGPNNNDFDFYSSAVDDITFDDLLLLNPTQGIFINTTNNGRVNFYRLRMQPMKVGIQLDGIYDVPRLDEIQFWSFWSENDTNVPAYTQANLDCIRMYRVDNPLLSNIFGIHCYSLIRVAQSSLGTVAKMHAVNLDADQAHYGIWYDSTVTNGSSAQIANFTFQSTTPPLTGSEAFYCQGKGVNAEINGLSAISCGRSGIDLGAATNCTLRVSGLRVQIYDQDSGANVPAVQCGTGSRVFIDGWPDIGSDGGTGGRYSENGTISVDDWRSYVATLSSSGGSITTPGTIIAKYKQLNTTVYGDFTAGITNVGTASGGVRISLPPGVPPVSDNFVGAGKERSAGKALTLDVLAGNAYATIVNYDGTFPGFNNCVLAGTFMYDITEA